MIHHYAGSHGSEVSELFTVDTQLEGVSRLSPSIDFLLVNLGLVEHIRHTDPISYLMSYRCIYLGLAGRRSNSGSSESSCLPLKGAERPISIAPFMHGSVMIALLRFLRMSVIG